MNSPILRRDLERFRTALVRQIGLQFDDAKLGFLDEVLQRRLNERGRPGNAYLWELEQQSTPHEIAALARELTVGETYFFRNHEQFQALAEAVLPERMRVRGASKVLRLLSAGCASGEEAYSMAIVARDAMADPSWDIQIRAVDINPAVLEKAVRGRYSSWALRETPPDAQRQWFRPDGRDMIIEESVRGAVRFESRNLVSDDPELWQPDAYDAIFCRNVLMYFAPEQMRAVVARIAGSLAPGGFLFLGHAETLRGVSDQFHLRHTHKTFYYERKEGADTFCPRPAETGSPSVSGLTSGKAFGADSFNDAWVDTIRQATERVAALVPAAAAAIPEPPRPPAWDPAPALDLLRKERFEDALDYIRGGPADAGKDPDILLLQTTLLAHSGQLGAAEMSCTRLLAIDELNAGAHYVLALCREHARDLEGASEHDRVAAYLDPAFAMPRLHLGLLARRSGDREAARRELAQALLLLEREDAARVLLFGGGFSREALVGLCQSILKDSGGPP